MRFSTREAAGRELAKALHFLDVRRAVILGLPRGGVAVARPVADALGAPLDIRVARKIGAPGNPEVAIGAVSAHGGRMLNGAMLRYLAVPPGYLERETEVQRREAESREKRLRGGRQPLDLKGKVAVLVDDGAATGMTMFAAIRDVRAEEPESIVVALPVAAPETVRDLARQVEHVVVLETPPNFQAVGLYYDDFTQVEDEQVLALLAAGAR